MTKKLPGWQNKLTAYLRECAKQPFRPGSLDCGLFAGGAIKAMTGEDVDIELRGEYRTIDDAMVKLKEMGFKDHISYAASKFKRIKNPIMAQRGDLAVVEDMNGFPALGIVQGEHIYVMELNGVGLRPLTDIKKAFRV